MTAPNRDGIPLEGGPSEAFVRERASATPRRHAARRADAALAETRTNPDTLPSDIAVDDAGKGAPRAQTAARVAPIQAPLRSLQQWFASALMHAEGAAAGVEQLAQNRGAAPGSLAVPLADIERVLLPSQRLAAIDRIAIYADAYRARLVECLADDYPALQYALGDDAFETLCLRYIARHPSDSPNLNAFGRHMAAFCRNEERPARPFESDLATLEWSMVEVLHAASAEKLDLATLATVSPDRWAGARFVPSATVRVFELGYPVNAYFQAFRTDEAPSIPGAAWSAVAVFRDGMTIWRMDLSRAMHALLTKLSGGTPLGAALDALAEAGQIADEESSEVMVWFRDWVRHGFFARIETA